MEWAGGRQRVQQGVVAVPIERKAALLGKGTHKYRRFPDAAVANEDELELGNSHV